MIKTDGGPAFPLQSIGPEFALGYSGMTLRDYFAAKAMAGWVSDMGMNSANADYAAKISYKIADAMLKARQI